MTISYEELKQELTTEKARLEDYLTEADTPTVSGASVGYGNHMADDATLAYEQAKSLSLQRNAKGVLQQVTEALERFQHGTYGVCCQCGQSIDHARLKAIPYTSTCIHCAQSNCH